MRIGVIASIAHRLPPVGYGPWEQIASTLTEGFVAAGHDVTLFATADSTTTGHLHPTAPHGYEEAPGLDAKAWEGLHNAAAFERAGEFDVIANHFDFMPLTYSRLVDTPVVTTIHGFSSPAIMPVYREYDDVVHYVAISDADRHPRLHYAATVHHGIDTTAYRFTGQPGEHLLFFGRIHPDKGTAHAVDAAARAGRRLVIAGIIHDQQYFDELIAPRIDGDAVSYIGPVAAADRATVLGSAHALLHLIDFDEPFGYSVAEAMACGTPVIAHDRGSMRELILDGSDGFLTNGAANITLAIEAVNDLDRAAIRHRAIARFDRAIMIDRYLDVYETVLSRG
jgi:glycosyltransferase involved in cell wall biosynthesis